MTDKQPSEKAMALARTISGISKKRLRLATILDDFAEAARREENDEIVKWLGHRCMFAPPCRVCTYCAVREWIAARRRP